MDGIGLLIKTIDAINTELARNKCTMLRVVKAPHLNAIVIVTTDIFVENSENEKIKRVINKPTDEFFEIVIWIANDLNLGKIKYNGAETLFYFQNENGLTFG
tara:strand:- start:929 stop:1234 length:306 start_codon:yes stop_codon:yes gene_type:complete